MSTFFGSSGYKPGGDTMSELEGTLLGNAYNQAGINTGYDSWAKGQASYDTWKKNNPEGSIDDYNSSLQAGWNNLPNDQKMKYSMVKSPSESFTYKPGESGYDFLKNTSYTPKLLDTSALASAYGGIQNQGAESLKAGALQGSQTAMEQLGRRGILGGGLAQGALGNVTDSLSRGLAENARNVGYNLSNANMNAQQYNATQENQALQQNILNYLSALGQQQASDVTSRQEKQGYYNAPYSALTSLYGAMLQPASQGSGGIFGGLMGAVPGVSSLTSAFSGPSALEQAYTNYLNRKTS